VVGRALGHFHFGIGPRHFYINLCLIFGTALSLFVSFNSMDLVKDGLKNSVAVEMEISLSVLCILWSLSD